MSKLPQTHANACDGAEFDKLDWDHSGNLIECRTLTKSGGHWQLTGGYHVIGDSIKELRSESRIFFIKGPHSQIEACMDKIEAQAIDSYDAFMLDEGLQKQLRYTYGFPQHLMTRTWCKSNGFAGSKTTAIANLSWFRLLIKILPNPEKYYWHEMTFLIHQPHQGYVTAFCFDVPDKEHVPCDERPQSSLLNGRIYYANEHPLDFIAELQAVVVIDAGIWACGRVIRQISQELRVQVGDRSTNFNFQSAHVVLGSALENGEVLKVAIDALEPWLKRYSEQQTRHGEIPDDAQYDSLLATMQLLRNNQHRNTAIQLRLENEISLGFNQASQQDAQIMRMISIVTALFLPATFISTLFSMSFFDFFEPDQPAPVWGVTEEIWTYFAFAGPLTALALIAVGWAVVTRVLSKWIDLGKGLRSSLEKQRISDAEDATH